ncbi:major facilitator superfamily domain-containing protein [Suillus subaureus]|uniref:Major facilitator superfamily domain-containing protein n=1 Tax=Suillus subaureus TaxID=48587 RepID=A0A9P7EPY3_9AGAM|nr:major facilitator superfamily domain-containing protein [Suillus subaureus]KAG1827140.1 major facilitator superfamily domain-containing protein [Suillus subaureus]
MALAMTRIPRHFSSIVSARRRQILFGSETAVSGTSTNYGEEASRKLDFRLAFLVLIYIVNCMDRSNAAAARLRGFEEDLGMTGNQFNTLISILYVGYALMQAPFNLLLDRMKRPSIHLSSCMALWGAITIFIGMYHAALILRFFLGSVEAAFFHCAVFLLSRWYKRDELGLRTALFDSSGILAGLDGTFGVPAWRWLFFAEGTLTIVVAVSAIWNLPDFPSTPSVWLTPDEQSLAKRRMEEETATGDRHQAPVKIFSGLVDALMDWKVWWLGATLSFMVASLSCSNLFLTLSATMGYNPTISLLLCAPPWILGTATSFIVAWHSDATGDRFWHIAVAFVIFVTWVLNTFSQTQAKRAAATAMINSMGICGNIGASYFWPSSWGPSVICIAMCWAFRQHLARCNKITEAEERALGLPKGFRYLLQDTTFASDSNGI